MDTVVDGLGCVLFWGESLFVLSLLDYDEGLQPPVLPGASLETPYGYAMYEYVDMYTSMYSRRLVERHELCELYDLTCITM